jgi:hypothetical protein
MHYVSIKQHNDKLHDLFCSQNIFWGDHVKENEMDGTCITYGREQKHIQDFGGET